MTIINLRSWKRRHRAHSEDGAAPEGFLAPIDARASKVTPATRRRRASSATANQCSAGMPRLRQPLTTDGSCESSVETAPVPPSASMMELGSDNMTPLILCNLQSRQPFASCKETKKSDHDEIGGMRTELQSMAARLAATRLALEFETKAEFCRALKISQSTWVEFENGNRPISLGVALRIKKKFGVPLDWTICGDASSLAPHLAQKIDLAA